MIFPFHESLLSQLYPGFFHSTNALVPAIETFESRLNLPFERRHKVVWRLDAGFGGDNNVMYLFRHGYQFIVKGHSNRRAAILAHNVKLWRQVDERRFVAKAPTPDSLHPAIRTYLLRTHGPKRVRLTYLLTTLKLTGVQTIRFYDQRGGAETEFRADKSGGGWLHKRRKQKRHAHEAWIHLTDMAHNYLAWFAHHFLSETPFAGYGHLRIGRDLLRTPGFVGCHQDRLSSVKLLKSRPHARELLEVLKQFYE